MLSIFYFNFLLYCKTFEIQKVELCQKKLNSLFNKRLHLVHSTFLFQCKYRKGILSL